MKPNKVRIEALKPSQKSYMKYNDLVLSIWFQISWHAIQGFLGTFSVLNASIFVFVLSRSISIGADTVKPLSLSASISDKRKRGSYSSLMRPGNDRVSIHSFTVILLTINKITKEDN